MNTVTRRAAWRAGTTNGWHEDFVWFAAAVHQMKLLSPGIEEFIELSLSGPLTASAINRLTEIAQGWSDPMSWGYQSQVHGTWGDTGQWPSHLGTKALWQECAHNQWFFLPWHRAYLLEFEAVVRQHIADLGGPAQEWALPYWNYSDYHEDSNRLGLPLPLRDPLVPDGVAIPGVDPGPDGRTPNPLFTPFRALEGDLSESEADAAIALVRPHYANQEDTGAVSFGGGVLENLDSATFHNGREIGQLDAAPHGAVHNEVGGAMWLFQSAGLDTAFWLHHCNIDRLWETYARDLQHNYPFDNGVGVGTPAHQSWLDQPSRFVRPDGSVRTWFAPDLTDITTLGYAYDTTAPPLLPAEPPEPRPGEQDQPFGLDRTAPEPVADAGQVTLAEATEIDVLGDPAVRNTPAAAFDATSWSLVFDNIRADEPARSSYEVYLGLESGGEADHSDEIHFAGVLSLFGVYEASRLGSAQDGQRRILDVTRLVTAQGAEFRPLQTTVRLVPVAPDRDLAVSGVTVGRITLEFV